jgi:hypothetical protein
MLQARYLAMTLGAFLAEALGQFVLPAADVNHPAAHMRWILAAGLGGALIGLCVYNAVTSRALKTSKSNQA